MNKKGMIKATLITGLVLLSLGGWLLHYRIHPLDKAAINYAPFVSGILGVFVLPFLFSSRKTLNLAYLLNGFQVILATVLMGDFSIVHFEGPLTPVTIVMNTLLVDIGIAWAKFCIGKAVYDLEYLRTDVDTVSRGRYFRWPNMGWWWVHLAGFAAVYAAGRILWK